MDIGERYQNAQIASGEKTATAAFREAPFLHLYYIVKTDVGRVLGFDVCENHNRTISTPAAISEFSPNFRGDQRAAYPEGPREREYPIASWKVRRRDSWTSSPHSPPSKRVSWIWSTTEYNGQQTGLIAEWTPSGQGTARRVRAARSVLNTTLRRAHMIYAYH